MPREDGLADHGGLEGQIENAAFVMALRGRGMRDTAVLGAMERVPRARFAPLAHRDLARRDMALPLPCGAAMTAPTLVATMLALLRVEPGQDVLEVGTGSGYATALLAQLGAASVTSLERYATLVAFARANLGPGTVARVRQGDGLAHEAGAGGYDRILVHGSVAAPEPRWLAALRPGGRLVVAIAAGEGGRLAAFERGADAFREEPGPAARLAALVPGRALRL